LFPSICGTSHSKPKLANRCHCRPTPRQLQTELLLCNFLPKSLFKLWKNLGQPIGLQHRELLVLQGEDFLLQRLFLLRLSSWAE
jgi:hypothetical protein